MSSKFALPRSVLDFNDIVISFSWIWILPDELNLTNTVYSKYLDHMVKIIVHINYFFLLYLLVSSILAAAITHEVDDTR